MRVTWSADGGTWHLAFRLDPEDDVTGLCADGQPLKLATNSFRVELPQAPRDIHPDLLALAAWTVVAPWTRRRVTFDRPISPELAGAIGDGWGIEAGPEGGRARSGDRLAISYSGGADSVAVAAMLPDAPLVHFQRVSHPRVPNRWTHYRADVLASLAAKTGRELTVVRSDLEFTLAEPRPGYPEHHAVAAGALLLADELGLGGWPSATSWARAGWEATATCSATHPTTRCGRRTAPGAGRSPRPACTSCSRWAG